MTTIRLTLIPRAKFSTLSLYEKNAYLQALAADFCAQTGRPYRELDKDVLARLRRYYSRRVWADLKLTDDSIALLAEQIRNEPLLSILLPV